MFLLAVSLFSRHKRALQLETICSQNPVWCLSATANDKNRCDIDKSAASNHHCTVMELCGNGHHCICLLRDQLDPVTQCCAKSNPPRRVALQFWWRQLVQRKGQKPCTTTKAKTRSATVVGRIRWGLCLGWCALAVRCVIFLGGNLLLLRSRACGRISKEYNEHNKKKGSIQNGSKGFLKISLQPILDVIGNFSL